jgi:hypothetical protein
MVHWYADETMMVQRMREIQRQADRAQTLGLYQREGAPVWPRLRTRLGRWLIVLGRYLRRGDDVGRADVASSSQCGLR